MKLISKKFIREISKIVDCNICFSCMRDPIECSTCQNIWCKDCILQNGGKCPNKCIQSSFVRPHRIFRQVLNEVYIVCDTCDARVKQIDYEKHKSSKQCVSIKQKMHNKQTLHEAPLRKIVKRQNSKQEYLDNEQKQEQSQQFNNFQEDQDTDDSLNNIFNKGNHNQTVLQQPNLQIREGPTNACNISDIFSDDECGLQGTSPDQQIIIKQEKSTGQQLNILLDNVTNFKRMNISLFQDGQWQPLDSELNTQLNFEVIKYQSQNDNDLKGMQIRIKNTVFDFDKFEVYELFESVRVLENEEYSSSESEINNRKFYSLGIQKKRTVGKFRMFNDIQNFVQNVRVYFVSDSDIIYYQEDDQQQILNSFFNSPYSTQIKTARSDINLVKMVENNQKKMRDIRFEIVF